METEGQKIAREAFDVFDIWCREFREVNPDAELSILELAELYAKYAEKK